MARMEIVHLSIHNRKEEQTVVGLYGGHNENELWQPHTSPERQLPREVRDPDLRVTGGCEHLKTYISVKKENHPFHLAS